ncbi:MAG: hypothetical protein D5R99_01480 [Methanocalculus sp. MSAO_Arc1]|uniref:hypothetical protein n=1 Tax=Methanocalculus TaxID=71151 RepID=UPI000FF267FC|nr:MULTISPECIES: hypothetical protein [unclassified Methanocalculus]MCP1662260.1 hypothetical protein [Methanocalculus sp. AMF5]RQD81714.1 MAG: hypothetical protein D5R99_01480 [Methanocalculus sp. MSAO_Arc1]
MGRSIGSVRQGGNDLARRWERAARSVRKEEQGSARRLAAMVRAHTGEAFYAFDDPLEAAVWSVLLELVKEADALEQAADEESRAGEERDVDT